MMTIRLDDAKLLLSSRLLPFWNFRSFSGVFRRFADDTFLELPSELFMTTIRLDDAKLFFLFPPFLPLQMINFGITVRTFHDDD
jgi:hypothetical protein